MKTTLVAIGVVMAISAPALAGPSFVLSDIGGAAAGTAAQTGFAAAAALWSSVFSNNVTINLEVGFQKLGGGILAETSSNSTDVAYSTVRTSLINGARSADDRSSIASLAPTLSFMSNTPDGGVASSTTHIVETNQANRDTQFLSVNTANEKALGLLSATNTRIDASITFNTSYKWTFDANKGVTKGTFDFVGIAAHEIGHALGFESGVDTADDYASVHAAGLDTITWGTPLDLFRYDAAGARDWTTGGTPCLSVDGGLHCGAHFATGQSTGDHYQASHWKNGMHLGVLNPSSAPGQKLTISPNDLQAFDVIGWNLAAQGANTSRVTWGPAAETPISGAVSNIGVPEPGVIALLGFGLIGAVLVRRPAK